MAESPSSPQTPHRVFERFDAPYDESRFLSGHGATATVIDAEGRRTLQVTVEDQAPEPVPPLAADGIGATIWSPIFWELENFLAVEAVITNQSRKALPFEVHLENSEATEGPRFKNTATATIEAESKGTIRIPIAGLRRTPEQAGLLGLRGLPTSDDPSGRIAPERVERIRILVTGAEQGDQFLVHSLAGTGKQEDPHWATLPSDPDFFPFIDTFGQYRHADWQGKVHHLDDLRESWAKEAERLEGFQQPDFFSPYGGSLTSGITFEATGRFRAEQVEGRWTLVDPEGYPFFSMGVNTLGIGTNTPIDQRELWFEDPLWETPEYSQLVIPAGSGRILRGGYEGTQPRRFSFYHANLQRRYGSLQDPRIGTHSLQRLWSWGCNTIGSWSDKALLSHVGPGKAPYALLANSDRARGISGAHGFWRNFPDVFDPSFRETLSESLESQRDLIQSPWCLGVYIDNEQDWGYDDGVPFLAPAVLSSPADQPAKVAMKRFLQDRYDSIDAFNANWGTELTDWEAFLDLKKAENENPEITEDLLAVENLIIERYFEICTEELRKVDSEVLYMGCRFSGRAPDRLVRVASRHCDVLSYNLYWRSLSHLKLPEGCDRPILISEFHFGTLGQNHFHPGLIGADGTQAVADLLKSYLQEGLSHPQVIGFHWFQWVDQPNIGRVLDGENFGVGLVDVTDRPHPHLTDTLRAFTEQAYAPGVLIPKNP